MQHKEFVYLMEEIILTLDRLADRMRIDPTQLSGYPRQQLTVLVRLHLGGRARLKDIARREMLSTPNLCATFRKLERDGLVLRAIDEKDRRNVWYSTTPAGEKIAKTAIENFRGHIDTLLSAVPREDEATLIVALKTLKDIFKKMEEKYVK